MSTDSRCTLRATPGDVAGAVPRHAIHHGALDAATTSRRGPARPNPGVGATDPARRRPVPTTLPARSTVIALVRSCPGRWRARGQPGGMSTSSRAARTMPVGGEAEMVEENHASNRSARTGRKAQNTHPVRDVFSAPGNSATAPPRPPADRAFLGSHHGAGFRGGGENGAFRPADLMLDILTTRACICPRRRGYRRQATRGAMHEDAIGEQCDVITVAQGFGDPRRAGSGLRPAHAAP